jgi:hypothetical protein
MLKVKTDSPTKKVLLRSIPAIMLILGLAAPVLQTPVAQAADDSVATITVFAPGATQGAPVWVEYQDASGNWQKVDGWLGTLDNVTDNLNVPYKNWTVFPANFGQGPFRWVVLSLDGKSVCGISDTFNLPPGGGIDQTETIVPGVTGATTPAATSPTTAPSTAPAPAASATPVTSPTQPSGAVLLTDTGNSLFGFSGSDSSIISGYFLGLPADSWIAVQWGDGLGNWTTVQGWQGLANSVDTTTGQLIQQWTVEPANYGQGPFRWAVFDKQGGTLAAYSASFTLPASGGFNLFRSFSK